MAENEKRDSGSLFLPDFCGLPVVFATVVLAELFALVLSLGRHGLTDGFWEGLALTSLFMQWAGLTSALLLCLSRPLLRRMGNIPAGITSYLGVLAVIATVSLITLALDERVGITVTPAGADFLLRNLAIGAIVAGLTLRYFYVTHQWRRRVHAEGEARVQALQARIRPHFLFNAMNTIASLTRSDPVAAERSVEDLADLFRASLGDGRTLVSMAEELELTRRYTQIETRRLGDRLALAWDIDALPRDALIPPLTLQPLVENAILHGIEPRAGGGRVLITGRTSGEDLEVTVENPLPESGENPHEPGNRMAVENVELRLQARFGHRAGLEVTTASDRYRVCLHLPYRRSA